MKRFLPLVLIFACAVASAQTAIVKDTVIRTYQYSDPDPIPRPDRVYPYHRYQNFAFDAVDQHWKMVVLENDYLRVKIFPEIGGKIWSIFDKTRGEELFYDNRVIKFREISLRGPWTSGGIEFNYGVIGHAPSCASPVDYKLETKEDGSVSCYIGVQELLTRTRWMVEINLPKDAVWVRTRCFWHNYSGTFQPYYTWANSGLDASEDLELVYPAAYTIGHDGVTTPYPIDEGRDLSKYNQQNFGIDKSFHPGGSHKGFFGAYWAKKDFGMLHYALRDEKLGRKYFSWVQSGQGDIWVDILTDDNPQYIEMQSGRLFNQNLLESAATPYKQFLFTPYGTDEWNEYWLPYSQIGTPDDMTLRAVVNVHKEGNATRIGIYPLRDLSGELCVKDAQGRTLVSKNVDLKASKALNESVELASDAAAITIDGYKLWSSDTQETDRPHVINPEFDLNSAQGLMIHATYLAGMREYKMAEEKVDASLALDPSYAEALGLKAMLCYRKMQYEKAYECANKVLAINEYDPQANYISGLTAWKMGKVYDAMDRLELAAITNELRSAAYTKLAEIHFVQGDRELAEEYARKSLIGNQYNVTALELLYQCNGSEGLLDAVQQLDPLSHFPAAEKMIVGRMTAEEFAATIQEEMDWQNYLDLAVFYHNLGLDCKAAKMLEACPQQNALISVWSAYLKKDVEALAKVAGASIDLVFPFRDESYAPLQWAVENCDSWKCRYMLAMLSDFLGDKETAKELTKADDSDYAPYYGYRYTLTGEKADLEKAMKLDPKEWRYIQDLALKCYAEGDYARTIDLAGTFYKKNKDNFHVGDTYVKGLIAAKKYEQANKVIDEIRILPFEGMSGSHVLYHDIKIALAKQAIDKKQYTKAQKYIDQARLWPRRLGVGKPYDDLIDDSQEKELEAVINANLKK